MSTLKLGTIATQDGTESTDVTNVINGSAKAWVNFNGTGAVAIRRGFNVSSITDVSSSNTELTLQRQCLTQTIQQHQWVMLQTVQTF